MKERQKKFFWAVLLAVILILGTLFRLYKIDNSVAEWFSWRQSDTAAVGKLFIKNGFDLLHPHYYDLSSIQSGLENPQGYRFVEFPLYNALFAFLYQLTNIFTLEIWARLTSLFFSLLCLFVIYYLLAKEYGLKEAFFGSLFFAIFPFSVFYSRTILPDMPATSLATLGIFFSYLFWQNCSHPKLAWLELFLGMIIIAGSLLIKPTVIFFYLPVVWLIWQKSSFSLKKKLLTIIGFGFFSGLPLLLWRIYIQGFSEGIPANQWLVTSVNTVNGLEPIFFRPAFFRWVFFERINNLILGGYLTFFLTLGWFNFGRFQKYLVQIIGFSTLLYLFTFQGGNVQHEYYQILILPSLALFIGSGVGVFLREKNKLIYILKYLTVLLLFTFSFLFTFYQIRDDYNQDSNLIGIAEVIKSFTNSSEQIITDSQGDTTLLYLSERFGYPAPYKDLDLLKNQGAKYFVTMNFDYKEKFLNRYELVFSNDKFLLFSL